MKLNEVKDAAKRLYSIRRPMMLWGAPGVGKSAAIKQTAEELEIGFIDLRLSQIDQIDLRGLVYRDESTGLMRWAPPAALPNAKLHGANGILMLDEINLATPSVTATAYQLILDRAVGEYRLPPGWVAFAGGNTEKDKGYTHRMAAPLANRFVHITAEADLDTWCKWALEHDISPIIIAFLRFRPGLLHAFNPDQYMAGHMAFPSPRTWEYVSDILKLSPPNRYELCVGAIGEGAATELEAFIRVWSSIPSPDVIVRDPDAVSCPTDPATCYALAGALAHTATVETMSNIVKFAAKMHTEYQVVMMTDMAARHAEVTKTKAFVDWLAKNSHVIL